jgi:dihydrofolate reductase
MTSSESCVTIHMAASLDGYIARKDGRIDWLETAEEFADLPRTRATVEFYAGDLAHLVNGRLRTAYRSIWFVGGGAVAGECPRLGR